VLSLLRQALGMRPRRPIRFLLGLACPDVFLMSSTIDQAMRAASSRLWMGRWPARLADRTHHSAAQKFNAGADPRMTAALSPKLSGRIQFASPDEVPLSVVVPPFSFTRELKTPSRSGSWVHSLSGHSISCRRVLMSMGMDDALPTLIIVAVQDQCCSWLIDGWTLF